MGNCPSASRGKFSPNEDREKQSTDIILKPVDPNEKATTDEEKDDKSQIEEIVEKNSPPISEEETDEFPKNGSNLSLKSEDVPLKVPLIVDLVNLCISSNTASHHTSDFYLVRKENSRLLVRRGFPFKVVLTLNRPFDCEKDILCLVLTVKDAQSPSFSQNTQIFLPVVSNTGSNPLNSSWRLQVLSQDDIIITLEITPASNAIIGEWILEVDSRIKDDVNAPDFHYKVDDSLIILFNPWSENDAVYMRYEENRNEYVLSDSGIIWRGCHNSLRPCIWNFGQFEENILECCIYLLSKVGHLNIVSRADPISVVRHVSAILNAHDNHGVLTADWSGKCKSGKSPTMWSGSQVILQKYFSKKKPVKFGQCWTFAGLFTTVCRALGIPSRPVTNFSSAHDTNNSLTADRFFDSHGKLLENMNIDSIWNFHVWNEVWMLRPDLEPGGYEGWQAVDSTPQEESDGVYRCGPASVAAIKRGEVKKAFDTCFLYAEVNTHKVYWKYNGSNQPLKLIKKSSEEIGCNISTKAVGKFEREDITKEYKKVDNGSGGNEMDILRECKDAFSRYYINEELKDVHFELTTSNDVLIGSPIEVHLKTENKKTEGPEYLVQISLYIHSTLYTGEAKKLIKKDEFQIQLGPSVEKDMVMRLTYEEYERSLMEQCTFTVTAMAHVKETGFDYCAEDYIRLKMPNIGIQVDGEIIQNQPATVTATLTNPLPKPLKGGEFVLEGPGFDKGIKLKMKGAILPETETKVKCQMTPTLHGDKVIIGKFKSKELFDVDGYHTIHVKPASEAAKDNNSHL